MLRAEAAGRLPLAPAAPQDAGGAPLVDFNCTSVPCIASPVLHSGETSMKFFATVGVVATALLASMLSAASAQTAVAELRSPPAGAQHFIIGSTGGKHGDDWVWTGSDGAIYGRQSLNLRGQVWEQDVRETFGPDRMFSAVEIRGVTPQGDAAETFAISTGQATWRSPVDAGSAAYAHAALYVATGNAPIAALSVVVDRVIAEPTRTIALLPSGQVTAERLTSIQVGEGDHAKTVTAWALSGLGTTPIPVWTDEQGRFFGISLGLFWLPAGYENEHERLEQAQSDALAARMPELYRRLVRVPDRPIAFTHVRLYDADAVRFVPDQTVVVQNGRITAVGPANRMRLPRNAEIIDGTGKTLIPGLWDCHMHVGDDYTGVQELSLGVTSVRDPGNNDVRTMDRRARIARNELLSPNVYPSSLIDGEGPYTAQVANVAHSEAEAIALVDRAHTNGFTGVKFYGTFNAQWLRPAIAEAHRLGLHVHGHIPVGIRPMDAINAGYDEITHINWIIMQAMPDSVVSVSNGIARFQGPGRYAKDVNLDAEPMRSLIATMASRRIASDPTMSAFESIYVPDNGDLSPSYAPFVGTMPPQTERGFRAGGFAVPPDLTRADFRRSWSVMVDLLRRMHEAGIPIVAGTDGAGIEIIRELEIYVEAGFTPAQALETATIAPARLVGRDRETGSIRVGKIADLALIEGDPSQRIGDLRQTRIVMLGGRVLDADALRTAAGFSGRPH